MITIAGHDCELFDPPTAEPGRAVIHLHGVHEAFLQDSSGGLQDSSGGLADNSSGLRGAIEAAGLPTLAPRTGRSWWLDQIMPGFDRNMTPERFVVEHVRAEIHRRFGVTPSGIALIGTGMGGQGALRLAYRHPTIFPVAAAIAPAIDFHLAMRECDERNDGEYYDTLWQLFGDVERARQDTAILHVHPLNWPRHQCFASDPSDLHWHDGAVRLRSKLVALGIPHVALLEPLVGPGEGHSTVYYDRIAPEIMRFVLDALDAEARRLA
jgi:S-formylglutathione hydrolase